MKGEVFSVCLVTGVKLKLKNLRIVVESQGDTHGLPSTKLEH